MDIMSVSKLRYKYFFSRLAAWDWNHEVPILVDEEGNEVVVDENTLIAKEVTKMLKVNIKMVNGYCEGPIYFDLK